MGQGRESDEQVGPRKGGGGSLPFSSAPPLSQTLAGSPPPASACPSGLAFSSGGAFVPHCSHCVCQPPNGLLQCTSHAFSRLPRLSREQVGDRRPGRSQRRTEVTCFPFLLALNYFGWENQELGVPSDFKCWGYFYTFNQSFQTSCHPGFTVVNF